MVAGDDGMNNFWVEIGWRTPITVVTALISAVVYFFGYLWLTGYWQRMQGRRLRQAAEQYAREHGGRLEVALVLSVREDIRQAVEEYLDQLGRKGIQIFQVHQPGGFDDQEETWFAYLARVKGDVRTIRELGASRIFVFSNIPIALALMAGSTLTNGPEVVVHHFTAGRYLPVGRLTVETVRL